MDPVQLDFSILAPIGFVSIGAVFVLLGDAWLSRGPRKSTVGPTLAMISTLALMLAFVTSAFAFSAGTSASFNSSHPMLRVDAFSALFFGLLAVCAIGSIWLTRNYLPTLRIDQGEYYALLLLSVVGAFVMVAAVDLLSVYVGLELMSLPGYVLAGFDRRRLHSNEAGLKYFLMGAFASAVLLYGIALLYGATGSTSFSGLRGGFDEASPLAMAGLALLVAGFGFKISAVPFHQWTPDVYEGAPTPVTAFMSTAVKIAAIAALIRFLRLALPDVLPDLQVVFAALALATMVVGNAMALIQTNLKRMLAYSGIAHVGYLLIGFAAASPDAWAALIFYMTAYGFMNLGAFGTIAALARHGQERDRFVDLAGLFQRRPGMAVAMTLFLFALAGLPGTAGLWAKVYVFKAAVDAGWVWLAIVGVLMSVVSVYYYLRPTVMMFMREASTDDPGELDFMPSLTLAFCVVAVLWIGWMPNSDPFFGLFRALDFAITASEALVP